ncbi:hypothetical protein QOZ80_2AG0106630 [Eleusine coracana subsp. coracana]|nr:hypothetical protein QOZ80_2AG0106630 [Eleusine coracana subsp. coracana]
MLDAVWSGARGWLTPPVLFVLINLVIGTIAVMSKLMSSSAAAGDGDQQQRQRQGLMRAPSVAFDRLRCFSFSRLGLPPSPLPHTPRYPAFDDDAAAAEASAPSPAYPAQDGGGEWWQTSLLRRAPSVALDRLRGLSFSRRGAPAADDHAPATPPAEPSSFLRPAPAEMEHEQTHIERSQSETAAVAPARRRPRARKTRMAAKTTEEPAADGAATGGAGRFEVLPPAVEVDERADDFIRQFREQLRLQRIDSILRYKDTLRRTGTV